MTEDISVGISAMVVLVSLKVKWTSEGKIMDKSWCGVSFLPLIPKVLYKKKKFFKLQNVLPSYDFFFFFQPAAPERQNIHFLELIVHKTTIQDTNFLWGFPYPFVTLHLLFKSIVLCYFLIVIYSSAACGTDQLFAPPAWKGIKIYMTLSNRYFQSCLDILYVESEQNKQKTLLKAASICVWETFVFVFSPLYKLLCSLLLLQNWLLISSNMFEIQGWR